MSCCRSVCLENTFHKTGESLVCTWYCYFEINELCILCMCKPWENLCSLAACNLIMRLMLACHGSMVGREFCQSGVEVFALCVIMWEIHKLPPCWHAIRPFKCGSWFKKLKNEMRVRVCLCMCWYIEQWMVVPASS